MGALSVSCRSKNAGRIEKRERDLRSKTIGSRVHAGEAFQVAGAAGAVSARKIERVRVRLAGCVAE